MVWEIVFSLALILGLYLFREWYVKPRRIMRNYVDLLRLKGYKVLHYRYNPFFNYFDNLFLKNAKQSGDLYKTIRDQYSKYDAVVTNIGSKPFLEIFNPELIKHYYAVDKHFIYPKFPFVSSALTRVLGEGVAVTQGQAWKRKRQILNKLFNFEFLKSKTDTISEICDICTKEMEKNFVVQTDQKTGEKYIQMNILDLFVQTSAEVIFKLFLGIKTQQKLQGKSVPSFLTKLIDDSVLTSFQMTNLVFGSKFVDLGLKESHRSINRRKRIYKDWAITEINKKISEVEQQLKKNPEKNVPDNIVEALMIQKKRKNQSITEINEIYSELSGFLFAGTDTTSHFLQMMVYYIAGDPEIEVKVRTEIDKFMSTDDYSYENLKNLTYIDNIQKETIRLYGPALYLFWREAKEDNMFGDIPIRKETLINIMMHVNHISEKYFIEPNKFRPERWEKQCETVPNYVNLGFSAGARTCIGKQLANLQSKIALVKFLKRYKKIILPNNNFKMQVRFLPGPQKFDTKLVLND